VNTPAGLPTSAPVSQRLLVPSRKYLSGAAMLPKRVGLPKARPPFHDLHVDVLAVPGHTLGHIVYFIESIQTLFCGDTLFAMGCGRVFEGTHEQMYHSLNRLAALPAETKVYCTHEYTLSNAKFANHVEPDNIAIQERLDRVETMRYLGQCTLPSSIEIELETNPFLRTENVEEFKRLRDLKDQF
jgi:hydroxyacylglutathione hydrolase